MSESIILKHKRIKKDYQEALERYDRGAIQPYEMLLIANTYIVVLEELNAEYAHVIGRTMG